MVKLEEYIEKRKRKQDHVPKGIGFLKTLDRAQEGIMTEIKNISFGEVSRGKKRRRRICHG